MDNQEAIHEAFELRRAAAAKYKPEAVKVLLVAETPPARLSQYFYFEDVEHHDGLFWCIAKAVLGVLKNDRAEKPFHLDQLRHRGVFLIDLKEEPTDPRPAAEYVDDLIARCRALTPEKIIVIKGNVFDTTFARMRDAGLPVINRRIPFPANGGELRFASAFAQALKQPPPQPLSSPPPPQPPDLRL